MMQALATAASQNGVLADISKAITNLHHVPTTPPQHKLYFKPWKSYDSTASVCVTATIMGVVLHRSPLVRAATSLLKPTSSSSSRRQLHHRIVAPPPPPPTAFVPDPATFLKLIGRKLSQHASKITSWDALFNLTSPQLKELGIESAASRKYLLDWRHRFRRGDWGIGGDLKFVKDGVALVKLCDVPASSPEAAAKALEKPSPATMTRTPGHSRIILNLPEEELETANPEDLARRLTEGTLRPVSGLRVKGAGQICGPRVEVVKGSNGTVGVLKVQEGLWEIVKGHKVDGGERRKAEVRAKKRAAERKAA